ncbi:hypothetical protein [Streptomyces flavochromogenes]|uniref:hypothetical protein n=1 Tax=Streptomyces flavochromogenes TaxID=68199 RepID=UPI0004C2956A|nr:hypothetical protein [Streptomyces flavochromogenes]
MVEGRTPGPTLSDGGRPPAGAPSGPLSTPSSQDPPPLRRRVLLVAVVGGLDLATVVVQVRDGEGWEGARVFDGAPPHLGLGLPGTLLPGRKAVGGYGFDMPPAENPVLDVEVKVGPGRPALFWSGDVG